MHGGYQKMKSKQISRFWQRDVYNLVILGSALFIVLTLIAMFTFPGGTRVDPGVRGYSFFRNFFSELGFLHTRSGTPNLVSAALFFTGLFAAGIGLVLFCLAFPQFFTSTKTARVFSLLGSFFGILSGLCFIGVAFTPADIQRGWHIFFVLWAFRLFPVAVFCYVFAIFFQPGYPKRYAWLFIGFGLLLVAYILLLEKGPKPSTVNGLIIQVTGQKIIAYASIFSILIQSLGAKREAARQAVFNQNG